MIPSLARGGAERLTLDIVRTLRQMGHVCEVFCLRALHDYRDDYPDIEPRVASSWFQPALSGLHGHKDGGDLAAHLKAFRPDVVHSHLWEAEVALVPFQDARCFVAHVHDNMPPLQARYPWTRLSKKHLAEWLERRLVVRSWKQKRIRLLCISQDALQYARQCVPWSPYIQIYYQPNAISVERFAQPHRPKPWGNPLTLINIGSFVPKKNQAFLLDVLAHLLFKQGLDAQLILLGEGPLRPAVQEKAHIMGLADKVLMPGNQGDVPSWLARADVYVHSALYEPFGLVLLEAMAAGLPVVSLDGRGNRDILVHEKNGFLLTEPSPEKFAEAILRLHQDESLRRGLLEEGRRTAQAHDIRLYCERLLDRYYKV